MCVGMNRRRSAHQRVLCPLPHIRGNETIRSPNKHLPNTQTATLEVRLKYRSSLPCPSCLTCAFTVDIPVFSQRFSYPSAEPVAGRVKGNAKSRFSTSPRTGNVSSRAFVDRLSVSPDITRRVMVLRRMKCNQDSGGQTQKIFNITPCRKLSGDHACKYHPCHPLASRAPRPSSDLAARNTLKLYLNLGSPPARTSESAISSLTLRPR